MPLRRGLAVVTLSMGLLAACSRPDARSQANEAPPAHPAGNASSAVRAASSPQEGLPWIEDDYGRALAEAKRRNVPLFVDFWAPWCHTCLSMRAFILSDPSVLALRDRFVWATIDEENARNEGVLARFPTDTLPTFLAIDPRDESVLSRWLGSMSVGELRELLSSVEEDFADKGAPPKERAYRSVLREADHAALSQMPKKAAQLYEQAQKLAPKGFFRAHAVLVARMTALSQAGEVEACVSLALSQLSESLPKSAATIDFLYWALDCGDKLADKDERRQSIVLGAERVLGALAADGAAPLSVDDRSDAYRLLYRVEQRLGHGAVANRIANERLGMLQAAIGAASDPIARSVFEGALLETLLYLGRVKEAVAPLEASAKAQPENGVVQGRLARAYREVGDLDRALVTVDRAIALTKGPRMAVLYGLRADILEAAGRRSEAASTLSRGLAALRALPPGQRHAAVEASLDQRRAALEVPVPPPR